MGHLGNMKEEYRALVRRLAAGTVAMPEPRENEARSGWRDILEILYTPEEADLAARMPTRPASLRALEKRLGIPSETLRARLDPMCDKGLVMDLVSPSTGKTSYFLSPPVVGFFEFSMMRAHDMIPKKRMAEALHAYTHHDDTFAREVFGHETTIGRTLAHEAAISDDVPEVLAWERATSVVREARSVAVSLCYCRHKQEHLGKACDAPSDVCLSLNAGADFVARRGFGRSIEKTQALDILDDARARGLVQIADNVLTRPTYICNCCGCCCGQLQGINEFDLKAVAPSGFVPALVPSRCKGCSRCSRACPIGAIAMAPVRREGQRKNSLVPHVDEDRCIGCGVCATQCKSDALQLVRRDKRPAVPANAIEKSIRLALERGRLADLLVDHGAGRGSRVLNDMLRALSRLPGADKLLATQQVKSRFIRAALSSVRDPAA